VEPSQFHWNPNYWNPNYDDVSGNELIFSLVGDEETPKDAVPMMATQCAQFEPFAWSLTREAIGQALLKRHAVPTELPPKLLALVRKLGAIEGKPRLRGLVGTWTQSKGTTCCATRRPLNPEA